MDRGKRTSAETSGWRGSGGRTNRSSGERMQFLRTNLGLCSSRPDITESADPPELKCKDWNEKGETPGLLGKIWGNSPGRLVTRLLQERRAGWSVQGEGLLEAPADPPSPTTGLEQPGPLPQGRGGNPLPASTCDFHSGPRHVLELTQPRQNVSAPLLSSGSLLRGGW